MSDIHHIFLLIASVSKHNRLPPHACRGWYWILVCIACTVYQEECCGITALLYLAWLFIFHHPFSADEPSWCMYYIIFLTKPYSIRRSLINANLQLPELVSLRLLTVCFLSEVMTNQAYAIIPLIQYVKNRPLTTAGEGDSKHPYSLIINTVVTEWYDEFLILNNLAVSVNLFLKSFIRRRCNDSILLCVQ